MNKAVIDVEGRFIDNITPETKDASKSLTDMGKSAEAAQKKVDSLSKEKAKPVIDADSSKFEQKMKKTESTLNKVKRLTATAKLNVTDYATSKIKKAMDTAQRWNSKTYSALLKIRDSDALASLKKVSGYSAQIAGKTWTAVVKIKDAFTSPLRTLKNMLFNVRTLIAGIATAWAAIKFVKEPIALADAYSSAQIGFSTLLGESQGQKMMDDLDAFAKATPFKASEVISQTQRMIAMGWDAENIIRDMETIGDAAAATGKGEQGLQQIVTALAQIKTKGKLSTEELNQLAEAGVSAKKYIAEGLGYGSGDTGIAKMTKDLENGAIGSEKALQALLGGMMEYKGMMDKTANETVSGLWGQIEDTFEINIFRRWGQGLQDGAKQGFGSVVKLLDEADGALTEFGDTIYDVGKNISNWLSDKFQNAVDRVLNITDSYEFKNASLKDKVSMLWNGVIVDPLKEWWEGGGQEATAETAGEIGAWMGEAITKGLLALFGVTDVFADSDFGENGGMSIAQSFVKGFKDNFDGSAITDAFVDAISDVWGALPTWAKVLIGGYGVGKVAGGISALAGGILSLGGNIKNMVGSANAMTGILGFGTSTAINLGAGNLVSGGALGAGALSALGLGATAGGIAAGVSGLHVLAELQKAHYARKEGNRTESAAHMASGMTTAGGIAAGAAAGAAIGSVVPVIGTGVGALIGAGIGGVAGWFGGDKWADSIRKTDDAINDVTAAVEELETEEEKLAKQSEMVWKNMKSHMGDVKLSAAEIERLVDQIVWGDSLTSFENFASASKQAEASLTSLKNASQSMDKWMWKAGLGVTFNDDEIESIMESADEYINSAKSYLENKHYEFTASAEIILDLESDSGKAILEAGNAFFKAEQEKLEKAGKELGDALTNALKDGIISAEEEEVIIAAQQKIAEITSKIAQAQSDAEIELIKVKWGKGNLDLDSFDAFMASMQSNLEERMNSTDEAFEIQVSNLKLRYPDGGAEYEKELQAIIDGYKLEVESVKADVLDVELNMIGEAYNVSTEKLTSALQKSLAEGIDPIDWTIEQARNFLGLPRLEESSALAIAQMLASVADQLELVEVDAVVGLNITGEKNIQNTIDILVEDFDVPEEQAATVALLLTGDKEILEKIDTTALATELGVPESVVETIITKLKGSKSIEERVNVLGTDLVDATEVWQTITVNLKAKVGKIVDKVKGYFGGGDEDGQGFRGGIFGGTSSALESFARGGIVGYSNGGMVRGGSQLIRVAEEGSPEMIIPLSAQRRDRGIELWEKAGEMLKVPGFAYGGTTGGSVSQNEGFHVPHYESDGNAGKQTVQVDVGGIHVDIHVDATGHQNISEAIREQAPEIAESIAGIFADAFEAQFENTPVRGGAA